MISHAQITGSYFNDRKECAYLYIFWNMFENILKELSLLFMNKNLIW